MVWNLVAGSLGSDAGSDGIFIMLIPLDIVDLDDGTRRNISFDACVLWNTFSTMSGAVFGEAICRASILSC